MVFASVQIRNICRHQPKVRPAWNMRRCSTSEIGTQYDRLNAFLGVCHENRIASYIAMKMQLSDKEHHTIFREMLRWL